MSKILDKDFRNDLYKNLCEAGYSKGEATSIVSVKYRSELKDSLIASLKEQIAKIEQDNNEMVINAEELSIGLAELAKLAEFFKKNEKSS